MRGAVGLIGLTNRNVPEKSLSSTVDDYCNY